MKTNSSINFQGENSESFFTASAAKGGPQVSSVKGHRTKRQNADLAASTGLTSSEYDGRLISRGEDRGGTDQLRKANLTSQFLSNVVEL